MLFLDSRFQWFCSQVGWMDFDVFHHCEMTCWGLTRFWCVSSLWNDLLRSLTRFFWEMWFTFLTFWNTWLLHIDVFAFFLQACVESLKILYKKMQSCWLPSKFAHLPLSILAAHFIVCLQTVWNNSVSMVYLIIHIIYIWVLGG